jgi:NAD(P)-dependent dehydrogenase (short-subunit alcohol dehydrogenase family)
MGRGVANNYDLSGKTAVVTGGGRGIGRAIVDCLADSGAAVSIWDEQPGSSPSARSEVVDVADAGQVARALARFLGHTARLDIVVNNAGYLGLLNAFDRHDPKDWQKIIQVNLIGMMNVAQAVVPHMRAAGGGRIINMGSLAGKEGLAQLAAYSAASAGVIAFTKALSREVVKDNIFVNCIAPGPIDTGMIRGLGPEAVEQMISDSPMERLGTVEEVAQLAAWLCSDASRFNAGAVFDMSGGRARY